SIDDTRSVVDDVTNEVDPTPANNSATDSDTLIATPAPALTKSDVADTTLSRSNVVYTLTYTNNGSQGATGVTLTDTVPANTTFNATNSMSGWSSADGDLAGTVRTFTVGAVAARASSSADFAVDVAASVAAGRGT